MMILADDARAIRGAVEFTEEHDVRMILLSGRDAWKAKELLAEKGVPGHLGANARAPTHRGRSVRQAVHDCVGASVGGRARHFRFLQLGELTAAAVRSGKRGRPRASVGKRGLKGITLYILQSFSALVTSSAASKKASAQTLLLPTATRSRFKLRSST